MPTAVDAWVQLNDDYGARPLGDLLQPAIKYARDGFCVFGYNILLAVQPIVGS